MHLNITFEMGVTLAVLAGLLFGLIKDRPPDVLFVGAVVLLAAFGVIAPEDAFSGFANSGVLIVAARLRGRRRPARDRRDGLYRRSVPGARCKPKVRRSC